MSQEVAYFRNAAGAEMSFTLPLPAVVAAHVKDLTPFTPEVEEEPVQAPEMPEFPPASE
jgi:hypothetical protein